ncbi:MAG: tRNA epoxyqueuosine(34) reductase QueG [Sphingomonadales bacterium]
MPRTLTLKTSPEEFIKKEGFSLGFEQIGITTPNGIGNAGANFREFLNNKWYGDMNWLVEKADKRSHPNTLWPEAKSIIMCSMNYTPYGDPLANIHNKEIGNISVYARGSDYHDVFKKRLKRLAHLIHGKYDKSVKIFVDTAPVMEKPLAAASGLGWQGKHTNLVSQEQGSWFFLGAIFTELELEEDQSHDDQCGSCHACIDACPTNAFPEPYKLNATRCISYLTIEFKGHINEEFRGPMGNRIYGCDDCLAVCPWNKFAKVAKEQAFHAKEHLKAPTLDELVSLNDESFRKFFKGSPIKRTGRNRFIRNVLIAIGNSQDKSYFPKVLLLLQDQSPIVRAMAVWALGKISDKGNLEKIFKERGFENDFDVEKEWKSIYFSFEKS